MDFSAISSLNGYVKNLKMQQKWQQKKERGEFSPQSYINEWIEEQRSKAQGVPGTKKQDSAVMQTIQTKLASGKKLTIEEQTYLRDNNPVLYRQVKAAEDEQKAYERELKQCKTKEDVDRIKMSHISSSLATVNSVKNSTEIPKGQKLAILSVEQRKLTAIAEITAKFVKSGQYRDLPTDEEKLKAEADMREAQSSAETAEKEDAAVREDEEPKRSENAESDKEHIEEADEQDKKLTFYEAQNTPEMQKLRRAKARAAYSQMKNDDGADTEIGGQINIKA